MNHIDYNLFVLTMDIDWAPDPVIDAVADILIKNRVKCTWYVTHKSPAIDRLMENKELFECGIHPNFLPNTTHGNSTEEILTHVKDLVPHAKSARMHALFQSSHILAQLRDKHDIETELSLFLRETPDLKPHLMHFSQGGKPMLRFPYFWEDDTETINPRKSWDIDSPKYHTKGLKIINFHPMYVYLNCDTMDNYELLKKEGPLYNLTVEQIAPYINKGKGCGTFFNDLVKYIKDDQERSFTIAELAEEWHASQE